MKIRFTLFILFAWATLTQAQDLQYSYWQFSPISYNPAFTGAFYGNLRVNGLVRDQWRTVSADGDFQTLSLALDGNIPFGLKETDWVSVGISLANDKSGTSGYKVGFQGISAAYHLTIGKDASTILTLGGKYGNYSRGITDRSNLLSPHALENSTGPGTGPDVMGIDTENLNSTSDLMVGAMLFTSIGKTSDMRIGFAMDHLLRPSFERRTTTGTPPDTMSTVTRQFIERRLNAHAQFYFDLSDKVSFNPTLLYQSMGGASNILVQTMFSYAFKPEKEIYLNAGTGIRLADNNFIPVYLGADYKDWRFGFSYAINMGGLAATAREGAFELAVSKVISWQKKTKVNPKFICPRL